MKKLNLNLKELHNYASSHRFVCFGAGIQGLRWSYIFEDWSCSDNLLGYIDNNSLKHGTCIEGHLKKYPIMSLSQAVKLLDEDTFVYITSLKSEEMLRSLEEYTETEQTVCIIADEVATEQLLVSDYPAVVNENQAPLIPKIIHYAWFGDSMPAKIQENVEHWKELCPDYEFCLWNEKNYDVTKNKYMYQAYCNKAWGFVPDYIRLDVVWNEGGIYLDTDIEMIRRPNELLYQSGFATADASMVMNLGGGFGAKPKHDFIKALRDYYDDVDFERADGTIDKNSCNTHNYKVLRKHGYQVNDQLQNVGGINIYPMIFQGRNAYSDTNRITEKTFWLHHGNMSWMSINASPMVAKTASGGQ